MITTACEVKLKAKKFTSHYLLLAVHTVPVTTVTAPTTQTAPPVTPPFIKLRTVQSVLYPFLNKSNFKKGPWPPRYLLFPREGTSLSPGGGALKLENIERNLGTS